MNYKLPPERTQREIAEKQQGELPFTPACEGERYHGMICKYRSRLTLNVSEPCISCAGNLDAKHWDNFEAEVN